MVSANHPVVLDGKVKKRHGRVKVMRKSVSSPLSTNTLHFHTEETKPIQLIMKALPEIQKFVKKSFSEPTTNGDVIMVDD